MKYCCCLVIQRGCFRITKIISFLTAYSSTLTINFPVGYTINFTYFCLELGRMLADKWLLAIRNSQPFLITTSIQKREIEHEFFKPMYYYNFID